MPRSALVVLVAEAEPVVRDHRLRHDPMAARGVPAHVTCLHPFRPVVDEATAAGIAAICRTTTAFAAGFAAVGRFPDGVVYLVPDPSDPFSALTRALVTEYPDCPPYGGAIADPIPHLTVGTEMDGPSAHALEVALLARLPVFTVVDQLTLLREDDQGMWAIGRSWPLSAT